MGKVIFNKYYEDETGVTPLIQYTYTLPNFVSIQYDMNTPVSPMPMPEEDASENILIKIEGNSSSFNINWVIKDMSAGTVVETSKTGTESAYASSTIREQINFFTDIFRPSKVSSAYELILRLDEADPTKDIKFEGTFNNFTFNMSSPNLLTFNATAKFLQGTVATLYEVDTSSAPTDLVLTTPNDPNRIYADWEAPNEPGTGNISDYKIFYKRYGSGNSWASTSTGNTNTVKSDISGVDLVTGVYQVYVQAFTTGLGLGRSSRIESINIP